MERMVEILVAVLSAVGLFTLAWLLFGKLLAPDRGGALYAVIPVCGDADGLEQSVKHLLWLRGSGLTRLHIVVLDEGLSETGAARLSLLRNGEENLYICTPQEFVEAAGE